MWASSSLLSNGLIYFFPREKQKIFKIVFSEFCCRPFFLAALFWRINQMKIQGRGNYFSFLHQNWFFSKKRFVQKWENNFGAKKIVFFSVCRRFGRLREERGLEQWFSTFGCWRPTKKKWKQFGDPHTGFGDPNTTITLPWNRFWRPKRECPLPKNEKHWSTAVVLNRWVAKIGIIVVL